MVLGYFFALTTTACIRNCYCGIFFLPILQPMSSFPLSTGILEYRFPQDVKGRSLTIRSNNECQMNSCRYVKTLRDA
jgi:hypothetical protein